MPVGFIVLSNACTKAPMQVEEEVIALVRRDIGAVAAFKTCFVVDGLPKTRSGKILRGILLKIADGKPYVVPGTIEDMAVLDKCKVVITARWRRSAEAAPGFEPR